MSDRMDGYEGEVGATAQARQPAGGLRPEPPSGVSAEGAHQAQGELLARLRLVRRKLQADGYESYCGYIDQAAAEIAELRERYGQLIYSVARKHEGESRHETALRYIQERENAAAPSLPICARCELPHRADFNCAAYPASVDTRPKDGDGEATAPLASSAVPSEETADAHPHSGPSHDK